MGVFESVTWLARWNLPSSPEHGYRSWRCDEERLVLLVLPTGSVRLLTHSVPMAEVRVPGRRLHGAAHWTALCSASLWRGGQSRGNVSMRLYVFLVLFHGPWEAQCAFTVKKLTRYQSMVLTDGSKILYPLQLVAWGIMSEGNSNLFR